MIDWPLITSPSRDGGLRHNQRDDDHVTGCCYHPWAPYPWTSSHRTCEFDVAECCRELLGVISPVDALKRAVISIWWLCDQLSTPTPDADEVTLERSACGFILALMGSFLLADKKGVHVHLCFLPLLQDLTQIVAYSWGSVVLAQLY